ncbi:unnamed protein product, partial [Diamesa serratosioi]
MEIIFKVFWLIIYLEVAFGGIVEVEESGTKIPEYIRELIKDFNRKDSNIHDVVILNLENETTSNILNDVIKEIPDENPLIIPDIKVRLDDTKLKPASFVIITADTFDI